MSINQPKRRNAQIKSKKRVTDHAEVFTDEREVDNMLDLVDDESTRIDSRFLEPACGDGNFLSNILERKLSTVKARYQKSESEFEKYAILAVSSIYGVDLLEDNIDICRQRLFDIFNKQYSRYCETISNDQCRESAKFILKKNIQSGDALTLRNSSNYPLIFSEWSLVSERLIQRRDFRLDEMLDGHEKQLSIFRTDWEYDDEIKAFIPMPVKVFPLIDYQKVYENE